MNTDARKQVEEILLDLPQVDDIRRHISANIKERRLLKSLLKLALNTEIMMESRPLSPPKPMYTKQQVDELLELASQRMRHAKESS